MVDNPSAWARLDGWCWSRDDRHALRGSDFQGLKTFSDQVGDILAEGGRDILQLENIDQHLADLLVDFRVLDRLVLAVAFDGPALGAFDGHTTAGHALGLAWADHARDTTEDHAEWHFVKRHQWSESAIRTGAKEQRARSTHVEWEIWGVKMVREVRNDEAERLRVTRKETIDCMNGYKMVQDGIRMLGVRERVGREGEEERK